MDRSEPSAGGFLSGELCGERYPARVPDYCSRYRPRLFHMLALARVAFGSPTFPFGLSIQTNYVALEARPKLCRQSG